jgi:hypothetical protein
LHDFYFFNPIFSKIKLQGGESRQLHTTTIHDGSTKRCITLFRGRSMNSNEDCGE